MHSYSFSKLIEYATIATKGGGHMEQTKVCKECGGVMLLQKNICGEELYSCQNCRLDLYIEE